MIYKYLDVSASHITKRDANRLRLYADARNSPDADLSKPELSHINEWNRRQNTDPILRMSGPPPMLSMYPSGFIFTIDQDDADDDWIADVKGFYPHMSDSFFALLLYAKSQGVHLMVIDHDAPTVSGLDVHDWEKQ
jgi:hypothetical protein